MISDCTRGVAPYGAFVKQPPNRDKMIAAGLVTLEAGQEAGHAMTFTVDGLNYPTPPNSPETPLTTHQLQGGLLLSVYSDHRCDDAFRNNHAAYKKRNPDGLPPLGETALIVVCSLLDGDKTTAEIAKEHDIGHRTVSRSLERPFGYGLVTYTAERHNVRRYSLLETWRDTLAVVRRNMTTYGVQLRRELQSATERLAWAADKDKPDPSKVAKLEEKVNRTARAAGWMQDDPAQHVRRQRTSRGWQRWDTAERDRDMAQLRDEVQRLKIAGASNVTSRRQLAIAGYDAADVSRAMVR